MFNLDLNEIKEGVHDRDLEVLIDESKKLLRICNDEIPINGYDRITEEGNELFIRYKPENITCLIEGAARISKIFRKSFSTVNNGESYCLNIRFPKGTRISFY